MKRTFHAFPEACSATPYYRAAIATCTCGWRANRQTIEDAESAALVHWALHRVGVAAPAHSSPRVAA